MVAVESVSIKSKEESTTVGLSKDIGLEGGGTEEEDSVILAKKSLGSR